MAKPVTLPLWATDTTLATGTQAGQTTKLEPSLGVKQQGAVPGEEAPGRWYNWLFNLQYQWAAYLDGLGTDAQFLGTGFAFTGNNTFAGTSTFNNTVSVAGAIEIPSGYGWSNLNIFSGMDSTASGASASVGVTGQITFDVFAGDFVLPIRLNHGAQFDSVRFGYQPGSTNPTNINVYRITPNTGTGGSVVTPLATPVVVAAGAALATVTVPLLSAETVDNTNCSYVVEMHRGAGGFPVLKWAQVNLKSNFITSR